MILPGATWLMGAGASLCTFAGGLMALKLGPRLRFVTGLSGGAVVGLALFDLIPEAASHGLSAEGFRPVMVAVCLGFCLYMGLQRFLDQLGAASPSNHLGAGSLTLHSLFDGVSIGLAYKVSADTGLAVALAILAHDLCDGINLVSVALNGETRQARRTAMRWLCANATAPLIGVALATLAPVPRSAFGPLAALFAGAFLYIGAVELLPRSFRGWGGALASLPPAFGAAAIYLVVNWTQ